MTKEEKCKLAIDRGFTYNPETGKIYSRFNREVTNRNKHNYIVISLFKDGKRYALAGHQLAWYIINKEVVDCLDHINGIKDDNRIENLRSVTRQQNQFNRKNTKGYQYRKDRGYYVSQIWVNKKPIRLGIYHTEEEARKAYLEAKEKYHII